MMSALLWFGMMGLIPTLLLLPLFMLLLFFITSTISQYELSIALQKQYAHQLNDNDMNLPYNHLNDLIINLFIYLFIETYLYRIKQSAEVFSSVVLWYMKHIQLECGTWYHHPRRQQCVLSRNLRIFKVATWHYRCRHHLKNNCICYVAYYSAAKFTLPIDQSSNKAAKCCIGRS